jgi:hypothetical protein
MTLFQSEEHMCRVELEVTTTEAEFVGSVFGLDASPGVKVEIIAGTTVEYLGSDAPLGALPGLPEVIRLGVGVGSGVVTKIVADWLFQKFKKDRITRLRVNRVVIELTPDGLARKIQETIDLQS